MIKPSQISILCILLFCAFSISMQAQENEPTIDVENQTFQSFQSKNWSELIAEGNQVLKEGNDYYYLRLRLGIAYYEQKNYRQAEAHFKKALQFNSTDALVQEYLYFCYIFVGKTEAAHQISNSFSAELKARLKLDQASPIDFIMAEGGVKTPNKVVYPATTTNYYDNANYFQIGIKHTVLNKFSLFHAATLYTQNTHSGAINQKQYYLQASIPIKNNWLISPSFHYVGLTFTSKVAVTGQTQLLTVESNNNYSVGSIQVRKTIGKFDLGLGATFSNLSSANQKNHFGSLSFSVFGNSKLILGFTNYLHTSDNYKSLDNAFAPFIYFEPLKAVSVNLGYFKNQNYNIIESNGALVNNSTDLTTSRYSALVNFRINNAISFYTMYQLENKYEATDKFKYDYTLLLAGIKFNPNF